MLARALIAAAVIACAAPPATAQDGARDGAEKVAGYRIAVTLDPADHTLAGRETLTWRNVTGAATGELRFHLYLNAFKNDRTTFMKESRGSSRGNRLREGEWGYIDIVSIKLAGGADLLAGARFIRPDEGNPDDETVLVVPLPAPVEPGGSLAVEIEFAARLPRVFARTGYKNDFYFVAQWFPKAGVLETSGWNCHQFHGQSEFFSDFGTYDVAITVPSDYVVGATGSQTEATAGVDGTTTYRFVQDGVHDFAWTADPDYIKETRWFRFEEQRDPIEEERVARALGLQPGAPELTLEDVEVTLLIHPEHRSQIDRHFAAAFHAIRYFGYWYGRYPYRTLTVVDPAYLARGAGGMEYPTLITAGTGYFAPPGRHSPESVTIHEFGHQYWYGMVATNEFEAAFLDEGFNTYSTGLVLDKAYGPNRDALDIAPGIPYLAVPLMEIPRGPEPWSEQAPPRGATAQLTHLLLMRPFGPSDDLALNSFRDLPFLNYVTDAPIDEVTAQRRRYLRAPKADELARRSWEYFDTESYGLNSYAKTALVLRTLEGVLGRDVMLKVMRAWFTRYRFKHPTFGDFVATVNEVSGRPMDGFFLQAVSGSNVLDYAAADVSSREPAVGRGVFGPRGERRVVTRKEAERAAKEKKEAAAGEAGAGTPRDNEILIRRYGEFIWPQWIHLRYGDGTLTTRAWDGAYRWVRYKEEGSKLASVRVDPDGTMALDVNQSNNSRTVESRPLAGLKWWSRLLQWTQHVLYFYSGLS
ncbi:MAG TPA: M1 family metallopeptidase [Candidatus Polarisedimenticolia bacterium]|jgi:hypothetical protein